MRAGCLRAVGDDRYRGHVRSGRGAAGDRRGGDGPRRPAPGPHRDPPAHPRACRAARPAPSGPARRPGGRGLPAGVLHLDAPGWGRGRDRRLDRLRPAGLCPGRADPRQEPPDRPLAGRRRPRPGRHGSALPRRSRPAAPRPGVRRCHAARRGPGPGRRDHLRALHLGRPPPDRPRRFHPGHHGRGLRPRRPPAPPGPAGHRRAVRRLLGQRRRRRVHGAGPDVHRLPAVRLGAGPRPGHHRHDPDPARARRRHPARRDDRRRAPARGRLGRARAHRRVPRRPHRAARGPASGQRRRFSR